MKALPYLIALVFIALATAPLSAQTMPFEMAKPGLDIGIVVSDMAKARHFYGDILGLPPNEAVPVPLPAGSEMAWYKAGATPIKLRVIGTTPPRVDTRRMAANGIRLITIFVKDPDALVNRLAAAGLQQPEFISPEKAPYRYGFVSDPDGNEIEILTFKAEQRPETFERFQIGLTVSDAEKTRAFYTKTLGLRERPSQPLASVPGATEYFVEAGSTTIKFWSPPGNRPTLSGAIGERLGLRYFTFRVKDVDATYEALKARGLKIAAPPRNLGEAARVMLISDPDGNTIEFATVPAPKQ
jgi:catechol 2,3-dioxygenase-like lactoylglutathione lyase family enzyme